MKTLILTTSIVFLTQITSIENCESKRSPCKRYIDSLTKMALYSTADVLPKNDAGDGVWAKHIEKAIMTDISTVITNPNVIVAFVIDVDGSIKGERIIRDETKNIGYRMLELAKTFKWIAAVCNGRKVAMLHQLKTTIDFAEE